MLLCELGHKHKWEPIVLHSPASRLRSGFCACMTKSGTESLGWRLSLANQTQPLPFLLKWAGLASLVAMLVGTKSGINWSGAQLAELD